MADDTQAAQGPQIQRRERWLELPDEYEGFRIKIWLNAPTKLWMALMDSQDEKAAQAAAERLVLEHNGWLDFDGNPYPPPSDAAFWEEIPTELAAAVLALAQVAMQDLPNSLAPTKRRSRRG